MSDVKLINEWNEEDNVWTVNKTKGKGDNKEEVARIIIHGVPDEKTALHWAVDEGVITRSDLAVALRTKMTDSIVNATWLDVQTMLTTKADRKVDPDVKAIGNAFVTGDFSGLTPEQMEKLKAQLETVKKVAK